MFFPFQMFTDKEIGQQIGQRLAGSPTSTVSAPMMNTSTSTTKSANHITDESPIAALAQQTFSASMYEQSMASNFEDDRHSLNEGFILTEEKDGDITRIMSEPAIAGSMEGGEYVMLGELLTRESASDSMMNDSKFETPRGHCRSFSVDSTLDSSRKGSLKRGQPNSLKAGLLKGDNKEVQKLRRSFGLDKSDIGFPEPLNFTGMSDEDQYVELNCSVDFLNTQSKLSEPSLADATEDSEMKDSCNDSPGSVSRTKSCASLESNITNKDMDEVEREAGYDCDDESEAGFSTISGGTAMFVPQSKTCAEQVDAKCDADMTIDTCLLKTLAQQKQESKDSLLSVSSSTVSPVILFKEREMTRSISADSGKGSMCEEDGTNSMQVSVVSVVQLESPKKADTEQFEMDVETPKANQSTDTVFNDSLEGETPQTVKKAKTTLAQKSLSSQDLKKESEHTPSKVSRSKSLLESSFGQRKTNVKPNLQISAETHKLLARAGYINETKPKPTAEFDDFAVPGSFPFIKQPVDFNPRRESIIALQKNNAGYVKNNIQQFDKITQQRGVDIGKASPLRFPNSTSRRPRLPPVFIKPGRDIHALKHCIHATKEKTHIGMAKVPISTSIVKPSDPELSFVEEKSSGLKRKPSIYYADKDGAKPPPYKVRNTSQLDCVLENDTADDSVFSAGNDKESDIGNLSINQSLLDTINDVCTPLSEKVRLSVTSDRVDRKNKENNSGKMPDIKPLILNTPISIDDVKMRTASNKTPVELFKNNQSPRSPIKPLKRLGSSPHSPRNRVIHSPKLVKNNRRSLLTTIPDVNEDMNNF